MSEQEYPRASWLRGLMEQWANQIAARFNAPVYLVGSSLFFEQTIPRDTDVVVMLPDAIFFTRYGISGLFTQSLHSQSVRVEHGKVVPDPDDPTDALIRRYWEDMAKLSGWFNEHFASGTINLDFKVQDETMVSARKFDAKPRVRLDTLDVPQHVASGELP